MMTFALLQPLSFVLHAGLAAATVTAAEQVALSNQAADGFALTGPLAHPSERAPYQMGGGFLTSQAFLMPAQIRPRGPWANFKSGLHHLSARAFATTDTVRFFLKDSYHRATRRLFPRLAGAILLASPAFAPQIHFDKTETAGTPVADHVELEEFVGLVSTGMRLESDRQKGFSLAPYYAALMQGKGEEIVLTEYQKARIPIKRAHLDNDIFQTDDPYRSIVETSANALDASQADVAVTLQNGFYDVLDHGTGMTAEVLLTKLLIPKLSGKPDIEKQIGRFGIGFYTVLRHLKKNGDQVVLETKTTGENAYRLTFTYYHDKLWLKRETFDEATDTNHFLQGLGPDKTGTRVRVRARDIKRKAMTREMSRYLRYVNGPRRLLVNGSPLPKMMGDYHAVVTVGDVVIEQYQTEGENLPAQEILFRLPLATGLAVTRDQIQIDDAVITYFENAIRAIEDVTELNALVGLFAAFDKRKPAKNFTAMLRERARELSRVQALTNANLRFYPDNEVTTELQDNDNIVLIHPDIYPTELLDRFETPIEFRSGTTQSDSGLKIPITMVLSDDLVTDYYLDKTLGIFYLNRNTYQHRPNFVWSAFFMIPGYDYRIDWGRMPTLGAAKMVVAGTVEKYRDPVGGHAEEGSHGAEDEAIAFDGSSNALIESEHHGKPKRDRTQRGDIFQEAHRTPKNRTGTEKLRAIGQALERAGLQLSDLGVPLPKNYDRLSESSDHIFEHDGDIYVIASDRDEKDGIVNERGQWVIPPPPEDAPYPFIHDVAFEGPRILVVAANVVGDDLTERLNGVVDNFGQWVVPMQRRKIRFVRHDGELKILLKNETDTPLHERTREEYLNADGTKWEIVPRYFDPLKIYFHKDQIFLIGYVPGRGLGVYNATTQTWLVPPDPFKDIHSFIEDGVLYFKTEQQGYYGILRADDGKWILPREEGEIEYKSVLSSDGKTTRRAWFVRKHPNGHTQTYYSLEEEGLERYETKNCAIALQYHGDLRYQIRVHASLGTDTLDRVTITTPNGTEHTFDNSGRPSTENFGESFVFLEFIDDVIVVYAPQDGDLVALTRLDTARPYKIEATSEKDKFMIQSGNTLTVYAVEEAGLVEINRFDLTPLRLERFDVADYEITTNGRDLVVRVKLEKTQDMTVGIDHGDGQGSIERVKLQGKYGVLGVDGEWLYEPGAGWGQNPNQVKIYGGEIFIFPWGDSFEVVFNARGEIIRNKREWDPRTKSSSSIAVVLIEEVKIENHEGETYLELTQGEVLRVVPYGLEPIFANRGTDRHVFEVAGERLYASNGSNFSDYEGCSWVYNTDGEILMVDSRPDKDLTFRANPLHPQELAMVVEDRTPAGQSAFLNLSRLAEMASSSALEMRVQDLRYAKLPVDDHQAALLYAEERHWRIFLANRRLHRWLSALGLENVNAYLSVHPDLTIPEIETRLPLLVFSSQTWSRHYAKEYTDKIDHVLASIDTEKLYADIAAGRDSQDLQAIETYLHDHSGRSLVPQEARIGMPGGHEHRLADVITKIRSTQTPTLSDLSRVPGYNNPEDWRDLVHAVNHLHATHPNIFVREWLQNSLDELNRRASDADDRGIEMETYLHNGNLAVRFRDYGGMTEEEFLGLLEPGEGSKRGRGERGGFGIGFYSSLASANWVRVRTATRGAPVVIETEFRVERNPQGKITDIHYRFHRRTNTDGFYGTEIESERFAANPYFETARLQATFADMSKYISASMAQTSFNGEQTNAGRNGPLVTTTDEFLGRVELLDGLDNRILLGRLPLTDLPANLWQEMPPRIQEYYRRLGFYLNLDHTVVHPTPTRDRFRDQERVMERLETILPGLLLRGFLQRVVSQDHPEDLQALPREYFMEAYDSMARSRATDPELARVERDARCIDENRFEDVDFDFYSHGELGERRLLKLLTRIHFMEGGFEAGTERLSLHEVYQIYQRACRGDRDAQGRLAVIRSSQTVPVSIREKLSIAQIESERTEQTRQALSTAEAPYLDTKLETGKEYKVNRFTDPAYLAYFKILQRAAEQIFRHYVPHGQVVVGMHTIFDTDMVAFARHYRRGNTYHLYRTFGQAFDQDVTRLKTILERLAKDPANPESHEAYGRFLAEIYEVVSHELTHVLTERPDTPDFTHDARFYRDNGSVLLQGTEEIRGHP